jgi:hypothetical protein
MLNRPVVVIVAGLLMLGGVPRARAADQSAAPGPSPTATSSSTVDSYETRRIVDISLLAAGLAVAATGGYFAIKYNRAIGGCDAAGKCTQEDGRVPLGLGMLMVGGAMAVAGGVLWLQIPSTSTHVSLAPNGLVVAGAF